MGKLSLYIGATLDGIHMTESVAVTEDSIFQYIFQKYVKYARKSAVAAIATDPEGKSYYIDINMERYGAFLFCLENVRDEDGLGLSYVLRVRNENGNVLYYNPNIPIEVGPYYKDGVRFIARNGDPILMYLNSTQPDNTEVETLGRLILMNGLKNIINTEFMPEEGDLSPTSGDQYCCAEKFGFKI